MQLSSTTYPNNIRTVSGTVALNKSDVVLLCDTSAGAVTINLLEIPDDYWNTTYKLYVVDSSGNASNNPITINAGSGQTINGASQLIINTNNGIALIRIADNNKYISQNSYSSNSGIGVTLLTNAQMLALIAAGTVTVGQFYLITDAVLNSGDGGVMLQGMSSKSVSSSGTGIFLNADYQAVGNYSGVSGFVANIGIWSSTAAAVVVGDVVIYNNIHYKNNTGSWGSTPTTDTVNWTALSRSVTNGYISESDFVTYDVTTNIIMSRTDKRENSVDYYYNSSINTYSILAFQWGRDSVNKNKVNAQGVMACTNSNCTFVGNVISGGYISDQTHPSAAGQYYNNFLFGPTNITCPSNKGQINYNMLVSKGVNNSRIVVIEEHGTSCQINNNTCENGGRISVQATSGASVINNNHVDTDGNIDISSIMSSASRIRYNNVVSSSTLGLADIDGAYIENNHLADAMIIGLGSVVAGTIYQYLNAESGNNTWPVTLDCSNVSIYDLATLALNLPTNTDGFGIVTLTNCTGKVISRINNMDTRFPVTIKPTAGESVTLTPVAVGAATTNQIIDFDLNHGGINLFVGRSNGCDSEKFVQSGTLVAIIERYKYV